MRVVASDGTPRGLITELLDSWDALWVQDPNSELFQVSN